MMRRKTRGKTRTLGVLSKIWEDAPDLKGRRAAGRRFVAVGSHLRSWPACPRTTSRRSIEPVRGPAPRSSASPAPPSWEENSPRASARAPAPRCPHKDRTMCSARRALDHRRVGDAPRRRSPPAWPELRPPGCRSVVQRVELDADAGHGRQQPARIVCPNQSGVPDLGGGGWTLRRHSARCGGFLHLALRAASSSSSSSSSSPPPPKQSWRLSNMQRNGRYGPAWPHQPTIQPASVASVSASAASMVARHRSVRRRWLPHAAERVSRLPLSEEHRSCMMESAVELPTHD